MIASQVPGAEKRLGDVRAVSVICGCSGAHIRRLRDAGRMPKPIRLGKSLRWDLRVIDEWISDGCPDLREKHWQPSRKTRSS